MKLDSRLLAIANNIEKDLLIDIGCDHGKLAVFALIQGIIKKAVCVDISEESLNKARILVEQYHLNDKVEFVCTDGRIVQYPSDACVVIAGLGGNEICGIVGSKKLPEGSILVPHQDATLVREMLNNNDVTTKRDYVVKSQNKYYDVIVVGSGARYMDNEIILGKNTPNSIYYRERLEARLTQINRYHNERCSNQLLREKEIIKNALS